MAKERDLTAGSITAGLWAFALPLMLGNVMQQFYNLVDTWVVGRYIGWLILYADDIPDFGDHRNVSGKRCLSVNGLWTEGS